MTPEEYANHPGFFVIGRNRLGENGDDWKLQVSESDAAILDVGYVLESDEEMVQVVGMAYTDIALTRAYNGTKKAHQVGASWRIVGWPTYCVTPLPGHVLQDCKVCGAPAQPVGEPCRYCRALQERRA